MSDIVERLRIAVNSDAPQFPPTKGEVRELLDEIERLTDTSKRLRAIEAQQTGEIAALEARLAEAVKEIKRAALAFELLALADDTQRNGITPSVRAHELRAFLAKLEGRS